MDLITVDREKCNNDGICVDVCPLSLLVMSGEGGPEVRKDLDQMCIGCGHCVAACPEGALSNRKSPLSGHLPIPADYSPDSATAALFLRSRRSIRRYKADPVSREQMLQLLDIARFAPSGHNSQGISYLVVEGAENLLRFRQIVIEWMHEVLRFQPELGKRYHVPAIISAHEKGVDRILRGAPQIIVAHAPRELSPAITSATLALEYVELYAPALGLGTCWAGYAQVCSLQKPALSEFLNIPDGNAIYGILMVGHPEYRYHRLPPRNPLDVAWFEADAQK